MRDAPVGIAADASVQEQEVPEVGESVELTEQELAQEVKSGGLVIPDGFSGAFNDSMKLQEQDSTASSDGYSMPGSVEQDPFADTLSPSKATEPAVKLRSIPCS